MFASLLQVLSFLLILESIQAYFAMKYDLRVVGTIAQYVLCPLADLVC